MIFTSALLGLTALASQAKAEQDLPVLTLPWGRYQAAYSPDDKKIFVFKNVRFGAQPKRFDAPAFPEWEDDTIQDPNMPTACIQINTTQLQTPPGGRHRVGDPSQEVESQDVGLGQSEDCLFLDLYVPVKAFKPKAKQMPIVNWIYGGGFAFGAKDQGGPLYSGHALLKSSKYETIFVAGNYRVGAFGWLAGHYMEKVGQPNAGLYDQALLLEWIQKYISEVNGDKKQVSAWGESAGAGSILHHLVREEGEVDPLFHTFAAQSPAFEWAWDNSPDGRLDTVYKTFSKLAECGEKFDIDCLRGASLDSLIQANQYLFAETKQTGLFPVGPSVDGKWIKEIPTVSFSKGKYWKDVKSAIVSHCANEAQHFTPKNIDNATMFDNFLNAFLPGSKLAPERDAIKERYNCDSEFLGNYTLCLQTIIRDASFTCNTRDLIDSYDKTYALEYGFPRDDLAFHGSDLIPLFASDMDDTKGMLQKLGLGSFQIWLYASVLQSTITPIFQSYYATFAKTGNPNKRDLLPDWPLVDKAGDAFHNVLKAQLKVLGFRKPFTLIEDEQNTKDACAFWTELAKDITKEEKDESFDFDIKIEIEPETKEEEHAEPEKHEEHEEQEEKEEKEEDL